MLLECITSAGWSMAIKGAVAGVPHKLPVEAWVERGAAAGVPHKLPIRTQTP